MMHANYNFQKIKEKKSLMELFQNSILINELTFSKFEKSKVPIFDIILFQQKFTFIINDLFQEGYN